MKHPPEIVTTLKELLKLEYVAFGKFLPNRKVHSVLAGKNASKLIGRGLDFQEVRKYVSGDDIRNIDWKVTARTKETHTKVFSEEKERPIFTIVDQSSFLFFGSTCFTKSVIAAQAAAIAGFQTLKAGDRFGGMVFNDQGFKQIPPKRSRVSLLRFLEHIVNYNEQLVNRKKVISNVKQLNKTLRKAENVITNDYVVNIITDLSDANEETLELLIRLSMKNDVILVDISDDIDKKLPEEKLVLSDGEFQIALDGTKKNLKADYQASFNTFQNTLKEELRKYNISVMMLNTTEPVINQLKYIFGKLFHR